MGNLEKLGGQNNGRCGGDILGNCMCFLVSVSYELAWLWITRAGVWLLLAQPAV